MEQIDTNQPKEKKSRVSKKGIAVVGVILAAVIIVAVFFTASFAGGLSGKYYSTYYGRINYDDCMEFSGKNTVKFYQYEMLVAQGTYKFTDGKTTIQITLGIDGSDDIVNMTGSFNNDKSSVRVNGEMYVKK